MHYLPCQCKSYSKLFWDINVYFQNFFAAYFTTNSLHDIEKKILCFVLFFLVFFFFVFFCFVLFCVCVCCCCFVVVFVVVVVVFVCVFFVLFFDQK